MGGMGSGGHNRKGRATTADAFSLDVNRLRKAGVLTPGWSGGWEWKRGGERVADIRITATAAGLTLAFRTRSGNEPWRDVEQYAPVIWTPCRFGGKRPYFCCPHCGCQVTKLWLMGAALCRACHGLTYPSQVESLDDRMSRRANGIRMKLGGEPGMSYPFPAKPKWMHWQTYERHRREVFDIEWQIEAMLSAQWSRMCRRLGVTDMDLDL